MESMETQRLELAHIAKAITGTLTALVGGLLLVVTGNEGFADVTLAEWLVVAGQVLATGGLVYLIPNKLPPS